MGINMNYKFVYKSREVVFLVELRAFCVCKEKEFVCLLWALSGILAQL